MCREDIVGMGKEIHGKNHNPYCYGRTKPKGLVRHNSHLWTMFGEIVGYKGYGGVYPDEDGDV